MTAGRPTGRRRCRARLGAGLAVQLVAAVVVAVVAGCGVGAEDTARAIEPRISAPVLASPTPAVTGPGVAVEILFLVRDGKLVQVRRPVPTGPTADDLMRDLLAGPTKAEGDAGLTSVLLGPSLFGRVRLSGSLAIVELTAPPDDDVRNDDVLALGQVVCTLTGNLGVVGVAFVRDGLPTAVPRADGSLSAGPLTAGDYATLLATR